jgi:hypothetical protein
MAVPSTSRGLASEQIIQYLDEPTDENVQICDSGSELESEDDIGDNISSDNESVSSDSDAEANDAGNLGTKRARLQSNWKWAKVNNNFSPNKIQFSGEQGPLHQVETTIDAFKLFFDLTLMTTIVNETNRYAKYFINSNSEHLKPRSRVQNWKDVTVDELYVFFALQMLMGIVQKPTLKSYFSKNPLVETAIFSKTMALDRFELLNKFIHFSNNADLETYDGNKKLFKLQPIITHLNQAYKSVYNMEENIAVDESLTLWKGRLGIKTYLPLKSAKFGIKSYEVCESSTGYLWQFIIYTGSTTEIETDLVTAEMVKTTQIVVKLVQPLFNLGHSLWMDNYYNSPDLCLLLKKNKINVAGTLRLNRKNVPDSLKNAKLKRGELDAYHSQGIMVMKWVDKKPVTFISTFHDASLISREIRGKEIIKPKCIVEYNKQMGAVDLKDQKLQPYLIERKKCMKWYLKMFRRLLNTSVHNALIIYNANKDRKPLDHLSFRLQLIKEILETHGKTLESPRQGRPSKLPTPDRLTARHFIERIPPTDKKAKPTKRCPVCCKKTGKRKETSYWCKDCGVGLCFENCFRIYHTEANF